jgi:hypothetical protein
MAWKNLQQTTLVDAMLIEHEVPISLPAKVAQGV